METGERLLTRGEEFLIRGDEVLLLTDKADTVSLPQAVGTVAMSLYSTLLEYYEVRDRNDEERRIRLEKEIRLQSTALKSLSDACVATHDVRL